MKLQVEIAQNLKQKQKLTQQQRYALSILAMSDTSFMVEAQRMLEENPLLEYKEMSHAYDDSDIYEHASRIVAQKETLTDVLYTQLHYSDFPYPYALAEFLITALDDDGYLRMDLETIAECSGFAPDMVEDAIYFLQNFEPYGVFARNVQECILIQLCMQEDEDTQTALIIVNDYMSELANHNYGKIATALQIDCAKVKQIAAKIATLQPRPGAQYAKACAYIAPDARISVEDEAIHIDLIRRPDSFSINHHYDNIHDEIAMAYIKKATKEAQLFIDSFTKRCTTLTAILTCICEHQKNFFLHHERLIPFTMLQVAKEIGFHESTISRAIAQKSLEFENRIIPLKDFFPHVVSGTSSDVIYDRLKAIIHKENKQKPYSDAQLATLLKQEGITISRRTVAKYREQCMIPSAQKRRNQEEDIS